MNALNSEFESNSTTILSILVTCAGQLKQPYCNQAADLLNNQKECTNLIREIDDESEPGQSREKTFMAICGGAETYLSKLHKPPFVRQQRWELLDFWLRQIYSYLNMKETFPKDWAEKPVIEEKAVTLVKALHARQGVTKQDLCAILGLQERMVQNLLRAVDPSLQRKKANRTEQTNVRFGGQAVHTKIYCEQKAHEEWKYYTPDTVHLVAFQWNVMQVGSALVAFYQAMSQGQYICQYIATDLWTQLSEYGKTRIRDTFGKSDAEFLRFLEELDKLATGAGVAKFCDEQTQWRSLEDDLSVSDKIMYAMKSDAVVSILLQDLDGKNSTLERQRVYPGGHGRWYLVPAELTEGKTRLEENAVQHFGTLIEEKKIQQVYISESR